jgi:uncharacterized protein (TIRG00374 family)
VELSRRHVVAGVLAWVAIVGVFVLLAGPTEFVDAATGISRSRLAAMLLMKAIGTVFMGLVLYTVSRSVGLDLTPIETIFLNTTVTLAKRFSPFGQASGVPIGGVIISRWTGQSFEKSVAAVSMKEIVGFTPGILVFVFGGSYVVLFSPSIPDQIRSVVLVFTLGVVALVVAVALIYRRPEGAKRVIHRMFAGLNRGLVYVPLVSKIDEEEVESRVDTFLESMAMVTSDKTAVVVACSLRTAAVITQGILLWLTLGGVGISVPVVLTVLIIPVSLLAAGLPTPGGSGGVEGVQILFLLAVTGGSGEAAIITAVTISRGIIYWSPVVIGSLTLGGIGAKRRWLSG